MSGTLLTLGLLFTTSRALEAGIAGDCFVSLPVQSIYRTQSDVVKRGTPSASLSDAYVSHLVAIALGMPPQTVETVIDSGSFSSWVNPNCNYAPDPGLCGRSLPYNVTMSTTAVVLPDADQTYSYAPDGSVQVRVGFVNDTVKVGEANVPTVRFGVAKFSIGVSTGILGLGPNPNITIGFSQDNGNGGIIAAMAREGIISSRAYSLTLGSSNVSYGQAGRS
jgi:Eukaryotic aspartyl protease